MVKAGRGDDQYMLRLPPGMRDKLKSVASGNGRSINSEIISRLEDSLGMLGPTIDKKEARRRVEVAMRALQSALMDLEMSEMIE